MTEFKVDRSHQARIAQEVRDVPGRSSCFHSGAGEVAGGIGPAKLQCGLATGVPQRGYVLRQAGLLGALQALGRENSRLLQVAAKYREYREPEQHVGAPVFEPVRITGHQNSLKLG